MIVTAAIAPASPWVFLFPSRLLVPRNPNGVCSKWKMAGTHRARPAKNRKGKGGAGAPPAAAIRERPSGGRLPAG